MSAERDEYIAELTIAGHTAPQIAAELGITRRTVQRARLRRGVAKPGPSFLTDAEIRLAETLLDDGASYGEVARTLNRTAPAIREHFPGRSIWKPGSGREYREYNEALAAIPPHINRAGAA